jgi:hypothetical protein
VVDDELVLTAVVEPFVKRSSLPDGVEVHTDSIRAGNNRSTDDVVTVKQRTGNRFTDSVNIN